MWRPSIAWLITLAAEFRELKEIKDKAIKEKLSWTDRYGDAGSRLSDQCVELQKATRHLSGSGKRKKVIDRFS